MKRLRRWILPLAALALVAGALGFRVFSDPEAREVRRVRARLMALASAASFKETDPPLLRLAYAGRLTDYFLDPTQLEVTLGARSAHESMTTAQLRDGATALRAASRGLSVEFIDIAVKLLDATRTRAEAHLTTKIYFLGDPDYFVQEFKILLEKPESEWRVRRVSTVRTME